MGKKKSKEETLKAQVSMAKSLIGMLEGLTEKVEKMIDTKNKKVK